MTSDPLVCAVDIGTSAVRAALMTPDGRRHAEVRRERAAGSGGAQFDADTLWADVVFVLRRLFQSGDHSEVRCLAVAGHVGHVFLDDQGRALVEAGGWADTRGLDDAFARLWKPLAARAGRPTATGGAVPALSWLRQEHPEVHKQVRWVLSPKDYVTWRLTGRAATDATSAAYTLGLDVRRRSWDQELLSPTGLPVECFPEVLSALDLVGQVQECAVEELGLPAGLLVAAGGPDGTMGAAAAVGTREGAIVDVAGTTDVLMQVLAHPSQSPPDALLNPYVRDDLWAGGGATGMTGGAVSYWCRLLGLGSPAQASALLEAELAQLAPGCDGLFVSPFLTGSRFPDWRPDERAAAWGMTERHGPAHVVRAAQEGAAYAVRHAIDVLAGPDASGPVVLAGGTAKSASLAQLRADVLGREILACEEADVSLLGAAMVAVVAAGIEPDLATAQQRLKPRVVSYHPDSRRSRTYNDLFNEWSSRSVVPHHAMP